MAADPAVGAIACVIAEAGVGGVTVCADAGVGVTAVLTGRGGLIDAEAGLAVGAAGTPTGGVTAAVAGVAGFLRHPLMKVLYCDLGRFCA